MNTDKNQKLAKAIAEADSVMNALKGKDEALEAANELAEADDQSKHLLAVGLAQTVMSNPVAMRYLKAALLNDRSFVVAMSKEVLDYAEKCQEHDAAKLKFAKNVALTLDAAQSFTQRFVSEPERSVIQDEQVIGKGILLQFDDKGELGLLVAHWYDQYGVDLHPKSFSDDTIKFMLESIEFKGDLAKRYVILDFEISEEVEEQ